ncbi:MAG: STAS domain-containing protein [bacterium]|nr:STAS domain-containing protein [bacterium]
MRIREEIREDVAVLTVSGALMDGPEVAAFHSRIKQLILGGINKVVVDFSRVKWFGSSMLGVLTSSLITVRKEGGDMRLAGVTKRIESIMMVTQLSGLFRTLDTVDRAVASFMTQPPEPAPQEDE